MSGEPAAEAERGKPFGGDALGFVDFLERDGRFVVMHQFLEDTDGDGKIDPELGDHGEPEGDLPTVVIEDLRTGARTMYDELIEMDPRWRFVVVRHEADLFFVDAEGAKKLEGADPRADANPCMPARQASIDASGRWLTYLKTEPDRVVVRDLRTGTEREIVPEGKLWRAEPTSLGWVMITEIVEDTDGDDVLNWPRRQGSCVCRWCSRFAKSMGHAGGFAGDKARPVIVDANGNRHPDIKQPVPVASNAVWNLDTQRVNDLAGNPVSVGPRDGCRAIAVPLDTGKLITRCGVDSFVWDVATETALPVKDAIEPLDVFSAVYDGKIGVRITEDGGTNVGRLDLATGLVEIGPRAIRVGPRHPSGWLLTADPANTHAYSLVTGATSTIEDKGGRLLPLTYGDKGSWKVVDPEHGKVTEVDEAPEYIASNGCFIEPYSKTRPVKGPFRWVCPS